MLLGLVRKVSMKFKNKSWVETGKASLSLRLARASAWSEKGKCGLLAGTKSTEAAKGASLIPQPLSLHQGLKQGWEMASTAWWRLLTCSVRN